LVPLFKEGEKQGVLVHLCNSSTQKAEARDLQVPGQPRLPGKKEASLGYIGRTCLKNNNKNTGSYCRSPSKQLLLGSG
jgi:hypothetical protein